MVQRRGAGENTSTPYKRQVYTYSNLTLVHDSSVKTTINWATSLKRSRYMADYDNDNNKLSNEATADENEFLVSLSKLMHNSVFGKIVEGVRNRSIMHATTDRGSAIKWLDKLELNRTTLLTVCL